MDKLPHDLLYEILLRLSAITLGNTARHVCRSWRSIISNPTFVDQHYTRLASDEDVKTLLFHQNISNYDKGLVMYTTSGQLKPIRPKHQFPVDMFNRNTMTLVCNGLVLYIYTNDDGFLNFYLCNPILNQSITIPPMRTTLNETCYCTSGFGYDSIEKDYKVVLIFEVYTVEDDCKSYLYCCTINTGREKKMTNCYNCWREVGSLDGEFYEYDGCFSRGKLHWFVCSPLFEEEILSFDLNTESLKLETFSTKDESTLLAQKFLGELNGGKLCVHVVKDEDRDWSTVWVKEEGDINGSENFNWVEVSSDLKDILFSPGGYCGHGKDDLVLYYVVVDVIDKLGSGLFLSTFVPTLLPLSTTRSLTQHDQDEDDMELD